MAFTSEDADRIRTAIASGTLSVRFRDREITYRSVSELKEALALAESQTSGAKPVVQYKPQEVAGRGLE